MVQTIVIVDKDIAFTESVRKVFVEADFQVVLVATEKEAEEILESTKAQLLITEIMLENADSGFCLAWKAKSKYPEMPVLIVSAVVWEHSIYFGLDSVGERDWIYADAFLDKPIRPDEIFSKAQVLLNQSKAA